MLSVVGGAYGVLMPLQSTSAAYIAKQLLNGLTLGMIFVLMAIGLIIIFGIMNIVNFAHGDFLLLGAYLGWSVLRFSDSLLVALVVAPLLVAVVGALMERFLLQRIYDRELLPQLLLTYGVAELLRGSVRFFYGTTGKRIPVPSWANYLIDFGVFTYPAYRIYILLFMFLVLIALYMLLFRTDLGMIIQAGTEDRDMVATLGVDVSRVYLIVFALASATVGLAGLMIAPMRGAYLDLGVELLVPAFVVVVVGGLGSYKGSIVAGILIGETIVLTGAVVPSASQIAIYLVMIAVLVARPQGLFGKEGVLE